MKKFSVALIGVPNCGKTTVFNALTGGNIKTGNWPGVTVEKREGKLKFDGVRDTFDGEISIVDLPGIYSLSALSEDEKVARDYVLSSEPDFILNILDGSNLERSLYLTVQLIEMKVPMIIAVNMTDVALRHKLKIDIQELSRQLSLPVIGISAVKKCEIAFLKNLIIKNAGNGIVSKSKLEYPNEIEKVISLWEEKAKQISSESSMNPRWLSVKLLEDDNFVKNFLINKGVVSDEELKSARNSIENILGDPIEIILADYRYGFIHGICQSVIQRIAQRTSLTERIDKIVLNKYLKLPVFFAIMYGIFWTTITFGGAFTDFFDILSGALFVDGLGSLLEKAGSPLWLKVVLADGIGGGIQTVSTFIPIIFFMFLLFALLEDSGYMARAAFVMDKYMSRIGLPGKAFVPLLVGFGCTVPAVLASRTLENRKDKLMTVFLAPLMSCGAKMPVYALFTAAFFPQNAALIVISLYLTGIVFAVLTGLLLKNTIFRKSHSYFVMELPTYHAPRPKHILFHTWMRLKSFILKAGQIIVLAVAVLTVINSFGTDGSFGNENTDRSVLAFFGKTITPVFSPMGIDKDNWPASVGLLMGVFAKESVVGTLNSLYGQMSARENAREPSFGSLYEIKRAFMSVPENLSQIFWPVFNFFDRSESDRSDTSGEHNKVFGLMSRYFKGGKNAAYAYLLFILLYFPCISAFAVIARESGLFLGVLSAVYLTLTAWITSTLFFQLTTGKNPFWIAAALLLSAFIVFFFFLVKPKGGAVEDQYS